jgi:hypothetical protein
MRATKNQSVRLGRFLGRSLAWSSILLAAACQSIPGDRPRPDAPSPSPISGEITLAATAQRLALVADESPVGPALSSDLDLLIRDLRQAATSGPPSPLVASKLGEVLLLQSDLSPATLDEAERWFRASLTGATGSQDWVPGWIGIARVDTLRTITTGDVARLASARGALANAEKAITTLQAFTSGPGNMPTAPDAQGLSPSDACSRLVNELAKSESLPSRFIAAGSAIQEVTRATPFHLVARLRARRALAEGELKLAEWQASGRQATVADIASALQPALGFEQNLVDVRVVMLEELLAVARNGARIDVAAAVAAHTQARTLLTLASASTKTPDATLLRAQLRANNLILSSYLNRELGENEARDRQMIIESSAQVIAIARAHRPDDGELLALASAHLAMVALTADRRKPLDEAVAALARCESPATTRTAADPISRADAEHLCRLATEELAHVSEASQ